jgi:hypothetical protein
MMRVRKLIKRHSPPTRIVGLPGNSSLFDTSGEHIPVFLPWRKVTPCPASLSHYPAP